MVKIWTFNMKKYFYNKISFGSITLELLIAFTILIINISAVMLIVSNNQSFSLDIEMNSQAIYKASSEIEKAVTSSKIDFNLVNPISYFEDGVYQKELIVEQIDFFTKKILSKIIWKNILGYDQEIEIRRLLTNIEATDGGDTCSSILTDSASWKMPSYYNYSSVNFSGLNSRGIRISDLDVFNNKLYLTALNTIDSNNNTFFVLDLPHEINQVPIYLSGLDNNINSISGLNAIKVSKNHAYVANAYTGSSSGCTQNNNCAQLQIIDISESTNPIIIANLKIPTITSSGKLAAGTSIFYDKGYVYLGLAKAISGTEFNIIDVGGGGPPASPMNPIRKGGYVIGNGVNAIFVKNNYASIASPNDENIIIFDISNPLAPIKISEYVPPNLPNTNGVGSNHGKSVFVVGNKLYLGRTYSPKEFYIFDISNYSNIELLGMPLDIGTGNKMSINKLLVRDFLIFFVTPSQFQIWNISNTNNLIPWTIDETMNSFLSMQTLGGSGITMDCEGNNIYVAIESLAEPGKDIISIITN